MAEIGVVRVVRDAIDVLFVYSLGDSLCSVEVVHGLTCSLSYPYILSTCHFLMFLVMFLVLSTINHSFNTIFFKPLKKFLIMNLPT